MSSENVYEIWLCDEKDTVHKLASNDDLRMAIKLADEYATTYANESDKTIYVAYASEYIAKMPRVKGTMPYDEFKWFVDYAKQRVRIINGRIGLQQIQFADMCKALERILISHKSYSVKNG